jgi:hypothetical protein
MNRNEKNTPCAIADEELSSVCGGALSQFEYGQMYGSLQQMAKNAGEGTPAGIFFGAAANSVRDAAVLNG